MSFRTTLATTLAFLILLGVAPIAHASSSDPEVHDGTGDAEVVVALWPSSLSAEREQVEANLSAYDLTAAYVASESRERFTIVIEVQDLDEGLSASDTEAPTESPEAPYLHVDYEAYFTIGAVDYLARAAVDLRDDSVVSNYTLRSLGDDGAYIGQLAGSISPAEDRITFLLDKAQVGDPADGSMLSGFFARSGNAGIVVDQAPDAKTDVAGGRLFEARYGDSYTFGQYRPEPRAFTLKPQGETSGEGRTGEPITFVVALENQAPTEEEIVLTTSGIASGWSVVLDTTLVQLSPGSNKLVTLTITPEQGAGRVGVLIVQGSSTKGDLTRETSFTVRHIQDSTGDGGDSGTGDAGTTTGNDGDDTAEGPEQALSDGTKNEDSPSVGAVALVALSLVGVAYLRRRR